MTDFQAFLFVFKKEPGTFRTNPGHLGQLPVITGQIPGNRGHVASLHQSLSHSAHLLFGNSSAFLGGSPAVDVSWVHADPPEKIEKKLYYFINVVSVRLSAFLSVLSL